MIEAIIKKDKDQIHAFNHAGHGYLNYNNDQFYTEKIPDQDVDQFYSDDSETLDEIYFPDDIEYPLDYAKNKKLEEIRSEAKEIITEKWPFWKQENADAGIYPADVKDEKDQDVTDVIQASNNAEDEVANATTIEEVEAVEPNWPSI